MSFEFSYLLGLVFLSWLLTSSFAGLGGVLISGVVMFSGSIQVAVLALLMMTLVGFYLASFKGKKPGNSLSQIYFTLRLFFIFVALMGTAFPTTPTSLSVIFFALLMSLPVFPYGILFSRHAESVTVRAYLVSTVIPAFSTIVIFWRLKSVVGEVWPETFNIVLQVLGTITLLQGSLMVALRSKIKNLLVHLAQSWLGLAVFLLSASELSEVKLGIAALASLAVCGPLLLMYARSVSERAEQFSKIALLGIPGLLGYSAYRSSVVVMSQLHVYWMWLFAVSFLFWCLGMISETQFKPTTRPVSRAEFPLLLRFLWVILVQIATSLAFYYFEKSGVL